MEQQNRKKNEERTRREELSKVIAKIRNTPTTNNKKQEAKHK